MNSRLLIGPLALWEMDFQFVSSIIHHKNT